MVPPPSSTPAIPAYSTVEPVFCALPEAAAGPPAARLRTNGLVAVHGAAPPPNGLPIALAALHDVPVAAGPRHTRHVPTITLGVCAGSSSVGASSSEASPATCAAPIVGGFAKLAAVHPAPSAHCFRSTPAPIAIYQFAGWVASMDGKPPSPAANCGHADFDAHALAAVVVPPEPFEPRPTSSVSASVGCCAKPVTSASDPIALFRLSKCDASVALHAEPVSATPSSERHRPPSLPRNTSGALPDSAIACCAGATCAGALHPFSALVVLRSEQLLEPAPITQRYTSTVPA